MRNRKLWVSVLAGFMALVMLLSLVVSLIPTHANAATSGEIKSQIKVLEGEKAELQAQMDALKEKQNANLDDIRDIVAQKNNIDQQIGLLYAEIQNINDQISAYSVLIADKQDELDEAEAHLAVLNEKNKERIRTMEEDGTLSYWSVLFKAHSFADLLDRLNMIEEIAAADQRRIAEMNKAAQVVAMAQEALNEEKASLEGTREELDAATAELGEKRVEADELMAKLLEKGEELEAMMLDFEAEEEKIIANIAQKEQEYNAAKQKEYLQWLSTSQTTKAPQSTQSTQGTSDSGSSGGSTFVGGNWIKPCSYVYVSSPYGYRVHPVYGYEIFHSGVDLAAYQGNPIYASRGGTVTTATYDSSAGYYVIINHGDGYSSGYLHMTNYIVSVGQSVSQGEVIGYVGSTGTSTGPHLHFTIYKNGSTVNPADYINF